jgi:hypothetical protein
VGKFDKKALRARFAADGSDGSDGAA